MDGVQLRIFAYQDSTFGYSGYSVGLGEYQYYFRRTVAGTAATWPLAVQYSNSVFSLLSGVLQGILICVLLSETTKRSASLTKVSGPGVF
jgi:hypothetical protein